mgnify:FL=1
MIFKVPDMSCNHCKMRIQKALQGLQGIDNMKINLSDKTVTVTGTASDGEIKKALQEAGYPVQE